MYRIDNPTSTPVLPTPAAVGPNPDSYFTVGNPSTATPATVLDDDWCNSVQEEICNVIELSGATLDKTVRTQLKTAIDSMILKQAACYGATSGTDTYTVTLSPAPTAYTTGMLIVAKIGNTNTGAATLNANSLGAKSLKNSDGTALTAGQLVAGMMAILRYDGTNLQLTNPIIKDKIGSIVVREYTSGATWTKPANLLFAKIKGAGGGGGGGGCAAAASNSSAAGGGGGGGGFEKTLAAASLGATETVTIGAGGAGGSAGNNNGSSGGTTSFGSSLSATGGSGGTGAAATTGTSGIAPGQGGTGSGGDVNTSGGSGGAGYTMDLNTVITGRGGSSIFAREKWGEVGTTTAGNSGGGGGCGGASHNGTSSTAGGAGASGLVEVTEYLSS